jgi:hypothetical protein
MARRVDRRTKTTRSGRPAAGSRRRPQQPRPPVTTRPAPRPRSTEPPRARGPVLGLPALLDAAVTEAKRIVKQERWKVALTGALPDLPALVERLDRPQQYYAIVAFRVGRRLTARIRVDAHDGRPGAAMGIDAPARSLSPFRTADDASAAFAGDPGLVSVDPFLVWRPCPQAPNAFMPLYRVRQRTALRFYRIDGEIFDTLTDASGV